MRLLLLSTTSAKRSVYPQRTSCFHEALLRHHRQKPISYHVDLTWEQNSFFVDARHLEDAEITLQNPGSGQVERPKPAELAQVVAILVTSQGTGRPSFLLHLLIESFPSHGGHGGSLESLNRGGLRGCRQSYVWLDSEFFQTTYFVFAPTLDSLLCSCMQVLKIYI